VAVVASALEIFLWVPGWRWGGSKTSQVFFCDLEV